MANSKLIIVEGPQGAGKTTWAKQWCLDEPTQRIRWNNDAIRKMLGKYWVPERENFIASLKTSFFEKAMANGYDIVVDNMNLNPKEEQYFTTIIEKFNEQHSDYNYKLEFKDFLNISLDECIKRDLNRSGDDQIGAKIITETYERYKERISKLMLTEIKKCRESTQEFAKYIKPM